MGLHGQNRVEHWKLRNLWCLHAYQYEARLEVDEEAFEIFPGAVSVISPGRRLTYRFRGPARHVYILFTLPAGPAAEAQSIALFHDCQRNFAAMMDALLSAMQVFPVQPVRAEVCLWNLLWTLSGSGGPARKDTPVHPLYQRAISYIEEHLGQALNVAAVARALDCSRSHLTRVFQRESAQTVLDYLSQRRAQRARHLLVSSTLPVKRIAPQIGIADLQQFNKFVRKHWRVSPRRLRAGAFHPPGG